MTEFVFSHITSMVFIVSQLLIVISAIVLLAITIRAYKMTRYRKMIYVIIAFSLFAVQHTINFVDQGLADIMSDDIVFAIAGVVQLAIMAMFFLAIVKK